MNDRTPVIAALLAVSACAPAVSNAQALVDVSSLDSTIRTDIKYSTADNFVGEVVDGYAAPRCLLSAEAATALVAVQQDLRKHGFSLLVFDCYRPQRAVDHFVRWAADTTDVSTKAEYYPGVAKSRLFDEGYIAERSGHSRASTIDLTIGRLKEDGSVAPLDMGTPFDFFDPLSHTESPGVSPEQLANRLLLRDAMEAGGFRNYTAEWWHYTLNDEPYPDEYFEVPVR